MGGLKHIGVREAGGRCKPRAACSEQRAARIATVLVLGTLACLPTKDLSGYSNGKLSLEPSEASPGELMAAAPAESLPRQEADSSPGPAPSAAVADCGSECGTPTLSVEPEQVNVAQQATAPADDAQSETAQNGGDAGVPAATPDAQALAADAGASRCLPGSVVGPEQRCFELVTTESSWVNARTRCQSNGPGWDLTTIHDETQNAWLSSLLGSLPEAWIGASDTETEGSWHWLGDASAFWNGVGGMGSGVGDAYQNWMGGVDPEPNGDEPSDCLRMLADGSWADFRCGAAFPSLCEGPQL